VISQEVFWSLKGVVVLKWVFRGEGGDELSIDGKKKKNQSAKLLLLSFPLTYLAEKEFSVVVRLLTKQTNTLDICNKGKLRLTLTNIELDIATLAATHQAQGSH